MDPRLLALIRAYQAACEGGLSQFLSRAGLGHPFDWRTAGLARTGVLEGDPRIEYAFHGGGLRLTVGEEAIDFDFGFDGRTGGFTRWWLRQFAEDRPEQFTWFDLGLLDSLLQQARDAGATGRPFRSKGDDLEYLLLEHDTAVGELADEAAVAEGIAAAAGLRRERPCAAFFAWPDRQIGELGIARTFAEAAQSEPGFPLRDLRSSDTDPPDCIAFDGAGRRVAVEVTELVDGEANALAKSNRESIVWASWDLKKFGDRLRERLVAKDQVTLIGGPYDEYIVVVHCDEPLLSPETVSDYLEVVCFEQFDQIDRAFLLLSYSPAHGGYPYFRLYPPHAGEQVAAPDAPRG